MAEPKVVKTLQAVASETEKAPLLHTTGILGSMDFIDYLTLQGYVFISSSNDLSEFELGETGADKQDIEPTEPSFMFDVPRGLTVIPLWANVAFEVITGTDTIVAIQIAENICYASGGTSAVPARNARTDNPRPSKVINLYAVGESSGDIVAVAATHIRPLWHWSTAVAGTVGDPTIKEWRPNAHAYIVGPGSFMFYCHAISTEAKFRATFAWAEIPSELITQP